LKDHKNYEVGSNVEKIKTLKAGVSLNAGCGKPSPVKCWKFL
jgi:hypothetical protein